MQRTLSSLLRTLSITAVLLMCGAAAVGAASEIESGTASQGAEEASSLSSPAASTSEPAAGEETPGGPVDEGEAPAGPGAEKDASSASEPADSAPPTVQGMVIGLDPGLSATAQELGTLLGSLDGMVGDGDLSWAGAQGSTGLGLGQTPLISGVNGRHFLGGGYVVEGILGFRDPWALKGVGLGASVYKEEWAKRFGAFRVSANVGFGATISKALYSQHSLDLGLYGVASTSVQIGGTNLEVSGGFYPGWYRDGLADSLVGNFDLLPTLAVLYYF